MANSLDPSRYNIDTMKAFTLLLLSIVGSSVNCCTEQSRRLRRTMFMVSSTQPSISRPSTPSNPTAMILPSALTTYKSSTRSLRMADGSMLSSEPAQEFEELSFMPSLSTNASNTSNSDGAVRCNSLVESEYRLIEIPYFFEIQTIITPGIELLTRMESFALEAIADVMLYCLNEEIRRPLTVRADQSSRVVAAYSSSDSGISDQCEYRSRQSSSAFLGSSISLPNAHLYIRLLFDSKHSYLLNHRGYDNSRSRRREQF